MYYSVDKEMFWAGPLSANPPQANPAQLFVSYRYMSKIVSPVVPAKSHASIGAVYSDNMLALRWSSVAPKQHVTKARRYNRPRITVTSKDAPMRVAHSLSPLPQPYLNLTSTSPPSPPPFNPFTAPNICVIKVQVLSFLSLIPTACKTTISMIMRSMSSTKPVART